LITLINDYVIDVSDMSYTVEIDLHKKNKQDVNMYNVIGYYGSLVGAIKASCESMCKQDLSECTYTLTDAINIIQKNTEVFSKLLSDNIPEVKAGK